MIKFFFTEAIVFFVHLWHNTLLYLEEYLAVGLMLRLLFVPLFHDKSLVGKILSFFFRLTRILIGVLALVAASLIILLLAALWFLSPILILLILFIPSLRIFSFFFGLVVLFEVSLFINEVINKPLVKLWHIKNSQDLWKSSKLSPKDISWTKLSDTAEVQNLLTLLELSSHHFKEQDILVTDDYLLEVISLGQKNQATFLTPGYFWVAMLERVPGVQRELLKVNLKMEDFKNALAFLELRRNKWRKIYLWDEDFAIHHLKGVNRGWLGAPTPALDQVSQDLTKLASSEDFPEFVGRESVLANVINILSQSSDRNVLLVGEPGTGKTTLVKSLAAKIVAGDAPAVLATKRLVSLDLTKLLSSVETQGDLAQKVKDAFEEVKYIEDIIIFIDELQNLGIGEAGEKFNLYSLISPYLEESKFQFIASTESANYARIIEKNGAFARIFHKVEVPPATIEETVTALEQEAINLARYQKIFMTYLAIKELAILSDKLIHDRCLPDSALSLLKEAETLVSSEKGARKITSGLIKETLQKRVHVPIVEIDLKQTELLLNLENIIHQKLIDQEEAVKTVSDTLRRGATALREESRPIGSFLFVGPTGVGKTELAKTLAKVYFKTEGAFLSFDMSEYQTPDAVNRLIGTVDNPGELTEAVKNKPYALLLLDEFEKADPKILTLFLQVLENGRLTDASGFHVDFTNTIIIATSNAASVTIAQDLEKGWSIKQIEAIVKDELLKVFKPELINRFDEVVIFKPLSQDDLQKIVRIKLTGLEKMLNEQGYLIDFTPALVSELAKRGFSPVLGARPLRRLIQDTLEAKLSRMILENKLIKGEMFLAGADLLN